MSKTRKLYETGGSTVVSLPKQTRQEAGIDVGDTVLVDVEEGRIVISEAEIQRAHRPNGGGA